MNPWNVYLLSVVGISSAGFVWCFFFGFNWPSMAVAFFTLCLLWYCWFWPRFDAYERRWLERQKANEAPR